MDKKDYYSVYESQIKDLNGKRPSLLLHVCCGPCSAFPLKELGKYFDITVFYSNSNIYPETEYKKRIVEAKKVIEHYKKEGINIKYIEDLYDPNEFLKIQKPYKDAPEGGDRCEACIRYRLGRTYEYALNNMYDYFCSVMTVSQNKNAEMINKIGEEITDNTKPPFFLFSNFKKKGGLEEGIKISKKLNLYRQNYCGCEISFHEMESRVLAQNLKK